MNSTYRPPVLARIMGVILKRAPKGFQRVVVLSSLIAYITDTRTPEQRFITQMDSVLKLSRGGEDALRLPTYLSRVLWGGRIVYHAERSDLLDPKTLPEKRRETVMGIAQRIPESLRYATVSQIAADIAEYFDAEVSLHSA